MYTIDDESDADDDEVLKLRKRVKQKREHAWQRWKTEYVHSLIEHHRVNRGENACPEVGEMVLVVGEEKNRAEWKRGRVLELIKGKDNVVRGVKILTKGHTIDRPLPLVCSLELKQVGAQGEKQVGAQGKNQVGVQERRMNEIEQRRSSRRAAKDANERLRQLMED